ncbi:hypothetical protein LQF76_12560 [Gloeomargaritales cyanobacterium VI4D9]|nr:hypothetical protein LQF76_12560 [Gloeomargaritales cyanobacterium VI4D9]
MTYTTVKPSVNAPTAPGEWSLSQVIEALSKPLPSSVLETKKLGGRTITYIPWHRACLVLDRYAPGWQFRITNVQQIGDELVMTGSLSIPTSDGTITRESTGSEKVNTSGYGETAANAESQCFRRCCARFGLGLYLYQR